MADSGYDAVTVDDICAAANISKRTFFNYLTCKEHAIIGAPPAPLSEKIIRGFVAQHHDSVVDDMLNVALETMAHIPNLTAEQINTLRRHRKKILCENPPLALKRRTDVQHAQASITELCYRYFTRHQGADDDRNNDADTTECEEMRTKAEALSGVICLAVYIGHKRWLETADSSVEQLKKECRTALKDINNVMKEVV